MADISFDGLVLSGGGVKGIAQVGAMHYYYEKGVLDKKYIKTSSGTSIGVVIMVLFLLGHRPVDLFKAVMDLGALPKKVISLEQMLMGYGALDFDPYEKIIKKLILKKMDYIPTLKQLYDLSSVTSYITVSNITTSKCVYLSHITHPDMLVTDAIKMSCSLPLVFEKVVYNGEDYADGGIINNFPVEIIKDRAKKILGVATMGRTTAGENGAFISYVLKLITIPINVATNLRVKEVSVYTPITVVDIRTDDISISDVMSEEVKTKLFFLGYEEARCKDVATKLHIDWPISSRLSIENIDESREWDDWKS